MDSKWIKIAEAELIHNEDGSATVELETDSE